MHRVVVLWYMVVVLCSAAFVREGRGNLAIDRMGHLSPLHNNTEITLSTVSQDCI